ncbi:MAG TPA: hypothetical protein VFY06_12445, partial [Verrucomicrobiae bacterium]|nr:hypothetical protein [Verrucomicrobiae bacterium]
MNSWKVILATIVIYGAGVMSGGLLVNHIVRSHPRFTHRPEGPGFFEGPPFQTNGPGRPMFRGPRQPEMLNRLFLQQLDERLHLTTDQRDAIQKIMADGQNLMRKTMQDTRLEIREQLTPDQQSQFDELVKRPMHRPP